jgi:hypothetical protein
MIFRMKKRPNKSNAKVFIGIWTWISSNKLIEHVRFSYVYSKILVWMNVETCSRMSTIDSYFLNHSNEQMLFFAYVNSWRFLRSKATHRCRLISSTWFVVLSIIINHFVIARNHLIFITYINVKYESIRSFRDDNLLLDLNSCCLSWITIVDSKHE